MAWRVPHQRPTLKSTQMKMSGLGLSRVWIESTPITHEYVVHDRDEGHQWVLLNIALWHVVVGVFAYVRESALYIHRPQQLRLNWRWRSFLCGLNAHRWIFDCGNDLYCFHNCHCRLHFARCRRRHALATSIDDFQRWQRHLCRQIGYHSLHSSVHASHRTWPVITPSCM